ncbi:MAG TPA: hypothetical protein VGM36_11685 [Rhizomicrobium sp.]|jgi:hypothetical protein
MKQCLALTAMLQLVALPATAQAQQSTCNVKIDITDTDPKGTNVRAAPKGAVIAALKNPGDGWIEVHVAAQTGDWYQIDDARLMQADLPAEGKVIFHGRGFLHKSMLGVNGMQNGGAIYSGHDIKSRPIDAHAAGEQQVDILGCWGDFLKVHVAKGIGWTKEACTNMNTTCS